MRVEVLKTNPNVKNFMEKLMELDRTIIGTLQQLEEWSDLQRNYVYLFGIFMLSEMRAQLEPETRIYNQVKKQYDDTTTAFKENQQVYRINQKDNQAATLSKANEQCGMIRKGIVKFL
jgi:hypothetical protein